jgi:hypothetical protein
MCAVIAHNCLKYPATLLQVLLSLLDLSYHGPNPPPAGATSDVLAQLSAEHSSVPYAPGTAPQARFSHLTIYGAGYYTYLYARCLAASLWRLYFQEDPLSRAAGELLLSLPVQIKKGLSSTCCQEPAAELCVSYMWWCSWAGDGLCVSCCCSAGCWMLQQQAGSVCTKRHPHNGGDRHHS